MPRRKDFVTVGYELFDATRTGLLDGTLTMVISHPLDDWLVKQSQRWFHPFPQNPPSAHNRSHWIFRFTHLRVCKSARKVMCVGQSQNCVKWHGSGRIIATWTVKLNKEADKPCDE